MTSEIQALGVKDLLRNRIGHPDWLRGIGVGKENGDYYVKVNVSNRPSNIEIPRYFLGVEIRIADVGDVEASDSGLRAPGFGQKRDSF